MGYGDESRHGLVVADAALSAPVALQTLADKGIYTATSSITVLRIGLLATTATTGVVAVVDFDKRVTYGSDTGRVSKGVGSISVPIGTAINSGVYKEVNVDMKPGEQAVVKLGTASTAGGGILIFEYIPRSGDTSNMVKSA
jgi:hypothetical protein